MDRCLQRIADNVVLVNVLEYGCGSKVILVDAGSGVDEHSDVVLLNACLQCVADDIVLVNV